MNPPVFAWKPQPGDAPFTLIVARDAAFTEVCLEEADLRDPVFLPEQAFARGRYFWKWTTENDVSEVFAFRIAGEAVRLEIPGVAEWLEGFAKAHPRIYIKPDQVRGFREALHSEKRAQWDVLKTYADGVLKQSHAMAEPPLLPEVGEAGYAKRMQRWFDVMYGTRQFMKDAEQLALAYLSTGHMAYGRAAADRLLSVCTWDPEGPSCLHQNDEAHMSVIWWGPKIYDWIREVLSPEERRIVIAHFAKRGRVTYAHMHDRGGYGVTRFDSHAGREIVFLAMLAIVFHEDIPAARHWLHWLRPVLCGIWPIWAGSDGAWAEGPFYAMTYVWVMTMFASALKEAAGIDLYRKPFWRNHTTWRRWCFPPYAEWGGFGDHRPGCSGIWRTYADIVEVIARQTGAWASCREYVFSLRARAATSPSSVDWDYPEIDPQLYLLDLPGRAEPASGSPEAGVGRFFFDAGWAAIRTNMSDAQHDLALVFRSSPYGSISHSHADNNDFVLHVAGQTMVMPSGYYDKHDSPHQTNWVSHTKSHNCVTLSGASQLVNSPDGVGRITNAYEDDALVYFCGRADASYGDRAKRYRRHVIFLKMQNVFVLIEEVACHRGVPCALEWNLHAAAPFSVSEETGVFVVERAGKSLAGHFMYHENAAFMLGEGWQPPPRRRSFDQEWPKQYHLCFSPTGLIADPYEGLSSSKEIHSPFTLGVILVPGHAALRPARVHCKRVQSIEVAVIDDVLVLIGMNRSIRHEAIRSDAIACLQMHKQCYAIDDDGIHARECIPEMCTFQQETGNLLNSGMAGEVRPPAGGGEPCVSSA